MTSRILEVADGTRSFEDAGEDPAAVLLDESGAMDGPLLAAVAQLAWLLLDQRRLHGLHAKAGHPPTASRKPSVRAVAITWSPPQGAPRASARRGRRRA